MRLLASTDQHNIDSAGDVRHADAHHSYDRTAIHRVVCNPGPCLLPQPSQCPCYVLCSSLIHKAKNGYRRPHVSTYCGQMQWSCMGMSLESTRCMLRSICTVSKEFTAMCMLCVQIYTATNGKSCLLAYHQQEERKKERKEELTPVGVITWASDCRSSLGSMCMCICTGNRSEYENVNPGCVCLSHLGHIL